MEKEIGFGMTTRIFTLLCGGAVFLVLSATAMQHPYFGLIFHPDETVIESVSHGDSRFLIGAAMARGLPYEIRRTALLGVIELQSTAATRTRFTNEQADTIARVFSRDVPKESLLFLYPAAVHGSPNPRITSILMDPTERDLERWSAFFVLLTEPSLYRGNASEVAALIAQLQPEQLRTKMATYSAKVQEALDRAEHANGEQRAAPNGP